MLTQSPQWLDMDFSSNHNELFDSQDLPNASVSRWSTRRSKQPSIRHRASNIYQSMKGSEGSSYSYYTRIAHQSQVVNIIEDYSDEYCCDEEGTSVDDIPATYSQWDAELDNECLRACYRMKGSLVLDSTSPHTIPHILITPCDYWDDESATWDNQIEPQCPSHLTVPEAQKSEFVPALQPFVLPVETRHGLPMFSQPKTVFSFSKFVIDRSSSCVHRRQYKLAVCRASQLASSYRTRYDIEYLFAQIEKPFSWTDPAEALLASSYHHPHAIVIDSPHPFTIPHIIITAPPLEDLWASFTNTVPSPQDSGYGYYLTVPGHKPIHPSAYDLEQYHYHMEYEDSVFIDAGLSSCTLDSDSEEDDDESYGSEFLSTLESYNLFDTESPETPDIDIDSQENSSDSDSLPPETPDDGDDFQEFFGQTMDIRVVTQQSPLGGNWGPPSTSSDFSNWGDEDEEDLPPIDDEFYQSVLRRTQGTDIQA